MNHVWDHTWIKTLRVLMGPGILVHFWVLFCPELRLITLTSLFKETNSSLLRKPAGQLQQHTHTNTSELLFPWNELQSTTMAPNVNPLAYKSLKSLPRIVFRQRWRSSSVHTVNSSTVYLQIIHSIPQTNRQSTFTKTDKVHNCAHKKHTSLDLHRPQRSSKSDNRHWHRKTQKRERDIDTARWQTTRGRDVERRVGREGEIALLAGQGIKW